MRCVLLRAAALILSQLCTTTLGANLIVTSNEGNNTSPIMYGIMFEVWQPLSFTSYESFYKPLLNRTDISTGY